MLKKIVISGLLAVSLVSPVNALPGQKFETAIKLYGKNPLLENFTYGGTGGTSGSNHHYDAKLKESKSSFFKIYVDQRRQNILVEAIYFEDASGIVFDRSSISQFKLVEDIFSNVAIDDFKTSKYIVKRTDSNIVESSGFYEGKKFNYRIYRYPTHIDFAVISKKLDLKHIIFMDSICHGSFFDCPG